jgi:hypothetical protein
MVVLFRLKSLVLAFLLCGGHDSYAQAPHPLCGLSNRLFTLLVAASLFLLVHALRFRLVVVTGRILSRRRREL